MNNGQKHLAVFLPTLVGGGAERVLLNLAVGFADRGFPVDFVLAQCEGAFMDQFPDCLRLVELNSRHLKAGRTIAGLPALVRYLRRERPDALLTGLHANIIAVWAKRMAGIPLHLAISEHNTFSLENMTYPLVYRQVMPWLLKKYYPKADSIITVSEGAADDLAISAAIPRNKIRVILNPVITPEIKVKVIEEFDHPSFKPGEPPIILSVGRLTSQKDYALLIKAFAVVREKCPARLMILGEGEDRPALTTLTNQLGLGDDVSLPGFVPNPYPYMSHASLFVLSSRWEGLPTVLIEALYCGVPVVSTDCPSGPLEILQGGKYGKLVPMGDVEGLAKAMLDCLQGNATIPPKKSWLPYELDTVVDQYLSVLLGDHAHA